MHGFGRAHGVERCLHGLSGKFIRAGPRPRPNFASVIRASTFASRRHNLVIIDKTACKGLAVSPNVDKDGCHANDRAVIGAYPSIELHSRPIELLSRAGDPLRPIVGSTDGQHAVSIQPAADLAGVSARMEAVGGVDT